MNNPITNEPIPTPENPVPTPVSTPTPTSIPTPPPTTTPTPTPTSPMPSTEPIIETPQTDTSDNKKKKIYILLIVVAFFILIATGVVLYFVLTGCNYNGKFYYSGQGFDSEDGCNTCGCANGNVACTLMACEESDLIEEDIDEDSEEEEDTDDDSAEDEDAVQDSEEVTYLTYEDDYIRFEYPDFWSATTTAYNTEICKGISLIQLLDENETVILSISNMAGSGGDGYYYSSESQSYYNIYEDPSTAIVLSEEPVVERYTNSPFSLYWIKDLGLALSGKGLDDGRVNWGMFSLYCSNGECNGFDFMSRKHLADDSFSLASCTQGSNISLVNVYIRFDATTLEEFNSIEPHIHNFFDTVEYKEF